MKVYPLVNQQFDPENNPFLVETHLPTPARVYVNLVGEVGYTTHLVLDGNPQFSACFGTLV
jgi:hypothetical protein